MKKGLIITASLVLLACAGSYVGSTYAKYVSKISGTATAEVAKWDFDTENGTALNTLTFTLDETVNVSTLAGERIAPGTSGHFTYSLTNEDSEVGVLVSVNAVATGAAVPNNLKFYSDASFANPLVNLTGKIEQGDATGLTGNVYWRWEYETASTDYKALVAINDSTDWLSGTGTAVLVNGDVTAANYALLSDAGKAKCVTVGDYEDTTAGKNAVTQTGDVVVTINVTGTQAQPSTTPIVTGWDA